MTLSQTMTIRNKKGLHARAAAKFVQTVESFEARVTVQRGDLCVPGYSLLKLVTLGVHQGAEITLKAEGEDAEAVLSALSDLIQNDFGEHSRSGHL